MGGLTSETSVSDIGTKSGRVGNRMETAGLLWIAKR